MTRPSLVVAWEVTRACPLACAHCRAAAEPCPHPAELTYEEGRAFVDDVASEFPGAMLIFTGGEPLTRADTLPLAQYGASRGLVTALSVDVGRLLTPEICDAIRRAGVRAVSFSLHFPDAERSDSFAGTPGFHDGALEGLANLRRAGQHFQLHTTVMRANAALLPRMHRLVGELGAGAWELFFLVPTGRGRLLADQELPAAEQEHVLRWLYRLQRHSPFPVKQICAPHFRRVEAQAARTRGEHRSARVTKRLGSMSRGCLAGNGFVFVSHVGDVCGCGFLPLSVGNVRDRPFSQLYREAPLFHAFRDASRLGGDCGACEYRVVCGGCRARAYAASGDPLAEEPDCAYAPQGVSR
ncbi:MAG TPA: radical SAM protein [Gaiellaceae bacterium]|jgi:radical SAM protein with 4Fe4S-binding SPASM domain|nr:radical SAM protein [Gaiellaceae bacterium]